MSFGLIWPHFVGGHGESVYRPEGHVALGGGVGRFLFFFSRGDTNAQRKHW